MSSKEKLFPLQCKVMNYAWGKIGKNSLVYQFAAHNQKDLNENSPYAEFWMGDHPNAPSICAGGKRISTVLKEVGNDSEKNLSFLFKILSIQTPLSLQCHPNLSDAINLHRKDPAHYPDPNHKPECGFFLTKTSLLFGVREYSQIVNFFQKIPEFKSLISPQILDQFIKNSTPETFKGVMREVLSFDKTKLSSNLNNFKNNFNNGKYTSFIDSDTANIISVIIKNYPNDIGIFLPLILNVIISPPGKGLIIPTGTLHTYIDGDLIEIMALSDNVVRAAMTPKFVDVETLLRIMDFKPITPKYIELKKEIDISQNTFLNYYSTGYESFNLEHGNVEPQKTITIKSKKFSSILAVMKGKIKMNGKQFHEGDSILILGNTEVKLENDGDGIADFFICLSK
ncbi:hypothetical protein M9Y10_038120 [Tritrichomonas musculus]|uniref:mannose-6-phosphate isomerase n=1 Tax=Tritrichomonas musculus TaxID=1915356 RepID=A0ABR2K7K0_9EUKA